MIAHAETYRFTVEDYHKLVEVGILEENDRVELLDGEIIVMAPIGKHHAKSVRRLNRQLNRLIGDICVVDCQNAFVLNEFSEPQPDILLLRPEIDESDELPGPDQTFLAIEAADSSLRFDGSAKLRAYARAGLPEYWIVNLAESCVEVYREPQGEGYAVHFRRRTGETIAPAAFPDRALAVEEILP